MKIDKYESQEGIIVFVDDIQYVRISNNTWISLPTDETLALKSFAGTNTVIIKDVLKYYMYRIKMCGTVIPITIIEDGKELEELKPIR
jgi:hypothetical protein